MISTPPITQSLNLQALSDKTPVFMLDFSIADVDPSPTGRRNALTDHNLPPVCDPFIGYETIRQEVHASLNQPWRRLVILAGLGGVGKTRLAVTVARDRLHRHPDGVWLVELLDIDPDVSNVAGAIALAMAAVLGLPLVAGKDPVEQLLARLQNKQILLVLDNFERLAEDGAALLFRLLHRCPGVHLLVTSQVAVGGAPGHTVWMRGLAYPASDEDDRPCEATALFTARRSQQQWRALSDEDRRAMGQICRMVAGLPLAIELAAGLTREETPREIANRLRGGFDVLTTTLRDIPPRHRSLQAVFETAWRRLPADLQGCLARLSVFEGGFTADAAQHVAQAAPQQLAALCDSSLLAYDAARDRYRLHPVVRAYAAGKR